MIASSLAPQSRRGGKTKRLQSGELPGNALHNRSDPWPGSAVRSQCCAIDNRCDRGDRKPGLSVRAQREWAGPATGPPREVRVASYYVSKGYSVDLGLGQINSRNMRWLGLTWDTVFDPCTNIAAAGRVLAGNYQTVRPAYDPQTALRVALSMYNTGSQVRGFRNGYVGKVLGNAGVSDGLTPVSYEAGRLSIVDGASDMPSQCAT